MLKHISISARLVISFTILIAIFVGYIIFSRYNMAQINRLHRSKEDFLMVQTEILINYRQTFTEMNWLFRYTMMRSDWRQTADHATRRSYETELMLLLIRMLTLADQYTEGVSGDPIFPVSDNNTQINLMNETSVLVRAIYDIFSDNFFLSGNSSYDYGNMLKYAATVEQNLQALRQIAIVNTAIVSDNIEDARRLINIVSVIVVIGVTILAFFLAVMLAKSIADIRALVEQEKQMQEETNRIRTQFFARISHEIRTPITAIMGISEIQLRSAEMPAKIEEAFSKIQHSANTLLSIVNDILDFTKIESGKMSITNDVYEVASLISDSSQLHTIYQDNKNIAFKMHIDENLPAKLIGDELRIKQIKYNLLSNAFKYTTSGTVTLSVWCEKEQSDQVTLFISVEDTGMGMTKEQLNALSSRIDYTRFHERKAPFVTGTGLGIPIVFSLVQMMYGKIDISSNSEVSRGTRILVRIPQKAAGSEVLGKEVVQNLQNFEVFTAKELNFTPAPMPHGKVLVVDDVDMNLFVTRGLLEFYDMQVETCESGQAAIDKVAEGNVYDIIFMDYMMPGMNGMETLHILRDMGYTHPVVALTANAIVGQREEFLKNGFDEFITKPIESVRVNDVLIKFIRDKQLIENVQSLRPDADDINKNFIEKE